jgi:hypothetical protein
MGEARRRQMSNVIPMFPRVGGQQQPFDVGEALPCQCVKCKGEHFDKVFRLGLISSMASRNSTGQDVRVEYQMFLCRSCGHEFGAPLPAVVM